MVLDAWLSGDSIYLQWTLDMVLASSAREKGTETAVPHEEERMELVESLAERMRLDLKKRSDGLSSSRLGVWLELLGHLSKGKTAGAASMAVN